ncbi:MAG: MATE family efflux transporter [Clostridium argentinense]|uniref:Multidrug export protein MepA n=1 Tax=Clostridium faecium TaxID=2762223 RepID=A0ABR8YV29_9CLOT|nr:MULTISPECIES: MATE family efflux transporter [Clostridium]MBD8048049.1 MATE family efflux transporter [Clostridium faecium]MBS5822284.1 MATE family efflux transporter [Clostridium argentinense]MDU1348539.1 MATE family efflux transporter [Clostridium argentinense]
MDNSTQLGKESIGKLLLKFSVPAIIGMIVNAFYNIVDRIFIGQGVGEIALSGVTITFPISTITMAFGMLIGIGAAALISIRLGQQRKNEAEKIMGNAFSLIVIIMSIFTVVSLIFLEPMLKVFGASDITLPYAKEYIYIVLLGAMLQNIGFGLNGIIRSEGNPKVAMLTMLIGAITNMILDPVFIFVFGLGVKGAAIATVIGQALSAIWVLYYFTKGKSVLKLKTNYMKLEMRIIREIFSIGMAPFFMQLAASLVTVISNNALVTHGGDIAVGAMGVITSVAMVILMPIFGINQGAQPIIGYNYGAKNYNRVKKALKYAIAAATTITTIGFLSIQLFAPQIIRLFNKNTELVSIGTKGIKIYMFMLPIIGFQIVSTNYFQAIGKAKISMFLSLSRQVITLIPLLLIIPPIFGLNGVWYCGPTADLIASIITAIFLIRESKDIKRLNREKDISEESNEVAIESSK